MRSWAERKQQRIDDGLDVGPDSVVERLEEIAGGCDECARDATDKGEGRAWKATAAMIRDVLKDLCGDRREK